MRAVANILAVTLRDMSPDSEDVREEVDRFLGEAAASRASRPWKSCRPSSGPRWASRSGSTPAARTRGTRRIMGCMSTDAPRRRDRNDGAGRTNPKTRGGATLTETPAEPS